MKRAFAVYLGGKAKGATIEVHDLVFVVSTTVKAAFPKLRELWFGTKSTAHVDSWMDLSFVDGHRVELVDSPTSGPKLFLINIGYYSDRIFGEQHRFHFIVCTNRAEAKTRARRLFAKDAAKPHLDNVVEIDDLIEMKEIDGFHLRLTKSPGGAEIEKMEIEKMENVYWPLKIK